jgi:hypothetical protein
MTESKEYIRAQLSNRLNADCSHTEAKNNRWHYYLKITESIGWDWTYSQVMKADAAMERDIEMWKMHPSGMNSFEIEVREVNRREGIDEDQQGLTDFT